MVKIYCEKCKKYVSPSIRGGGTCNVDMKIDSRGNCTVNKSSLDTENDITIDVLFIDCSECGETITDSDTEEIEKYLMPKGIYNLYYNPNALI